MSALLTPKSASPTVGTGLALLTLIAVALLWATNARPISGYVVSALSLFLFAGVTLTRAEQVTGLVRDHALLAYLAYVASALLMSLALSGQDASGVVLDALVLLGYGAVYASAASLRDTCRGNVIWGLAFLAGALSVYGLAAHQMPGLYVQEKLHNHHAVTGTFVNPNHFATFLGFGLVVSLSLALTQHKFDAKPIILGSICLYALLQTGSRAGLAATAIGLACTVIAHQMARNESRGLNIRMSNGRLWIYAATGLGVILITGLGSVTVERLGRLVADAPIRITLYADVLQAIAAAPLTGYGLGSFDEVYRTLQSPSVNIDRAWRSAHSAPLETLFESGAAILVLPLAAIALYGRRLTHTLKAKATAPGLAAAGILATGLTHSLFDNTLSTPAVGAVFAAGLGLARPLGAPA